MFKKATIIFLLGFALKTSGQNLIINGGFEILTNCSNDGECFLNKAPGWHTPSWNTPDVFHPCFMASYTPPNLSWGFQYPRTGDGMGGGGWKDSLNREYLTNRFTETLKPNKGYCLSFYVNLGEGAFNVTAIDRLGAYFSTDSIYYPTFNSLPLTPQIQTEDSVFYADTSGWTKVELFYIAQGNEKYVTIGNFYPDSLTHTFLVTPESIQGYYFIDDVSLVECDVNVEENLDSKATAVYPNPASSSFNIQYNLTSNAVFELYSIDGKKLDAINLQGQEGTYSYGADALTNGVYLYVVRSAKGIIASGKFVLIK